jgi:hypothetical protein
LKRNNQKRDSEEEMLLSQAVKRKIKTEELNKQLKRESYVSKKKKNKNNKKWKKNQES